MNLFETTEVTEANTVQKVRLTVDGLEGEDLWLTDIKGFVAANYQLMYSMGVQAFVNAFNHRLGKFEVTGIHISNGCGLSGSGRAPFVDFYDQVNITKRRPTRISFDGITITGWATEMHIGNYSKQGADGHMFTLKFEGRINELGKR